METKQIYAYLERLTNLLRNEARREGGDEGLQPVQLEALHYLSICNRYSDTPIGVTEFLGQTKGSVSQSLKVLEKKGFLTKHADKNDKRIIHMKVSNSGKELLDQAVPGPLFSHACEHLPESSQKRLLDALDELLQAMQHANAMKSFGVCHTCRYNQTNEEGQFFCGLTQEPLSQHDLQLICREHDHAA